MRKPHLIVAIIAITLGTVFLVLSVTPPAPFNCMLTADGCASVMRIGEVQDFIVYFSIGSALMAVAVVTLVIGRNRPDRSVSIPSVEA